LLKWRVASTFPRTTAPPGVKTVVAFEGDAYVLDFPEHTRLVTDDGLELTQTDAGEVGGWWPDSGDIQRYGLRWIELAC